MKTFFMIGSLASALFLGWRHHELSETKNVAETRPREISSEIAPTQTATPNANARIGQTAVPAQTLQNAPATTSATSAADAESQPAPKQNWVLEKNRNWQSSLARGAYDNRQVVTTSTSSSTVYVVPQQTSTIIVSGRPMMPPPIARQPVGNRPPPAAIPVTRPVRPAGAPAGVQPLPSRPHPSSAFPPPVGGG